MSFDFCLLQLRNARQMKAIVIWSLVLMAVIFIGLVIALRVKSRLTASESAAVNRAGFTLSDLRRMLKEGQMTQDEFEKARNAIIGSVGRPEKPVAPRLQRRSTRLQKPEAAGLPKTRLNSPKGRAGLSGRAPPVFLSVFPFGAGANKIGTAKRRRRIKSVPFIVR